MIIVEKSLDRITAEAEEPHGKLRNVYNCSVHLRKSSSLMKLEMSTLTKLVAPSSVTEVGLSVLSSVVVYMGRTVSWLDLWNNHLPVASGYFKL